jgi:glycosyltransferase involved in cell wall biosynthesis
MRILWLGHFVPWPLRGGSLLRSYHLLAEAGRAGEVSFLGFRQSDLHPTPSSLEEGRSALAAVCARVRILGIPSERGPLFRERLVLQGLRGKPYDEAWLSSEEMRRALVDEVATFGPDVIHVDTIGLAPYLSLVPHVPAILNHHNIESQMMARRAARSSNIVSRVVLRRQASLLEALERRWVPQARRNLVVSELDGERLVETVRGAVVEVVPNGVDIDYFRASRDRSVIRPRSMVFAGGQNYYPNRSAMQWFLAKIFPLIRERYPDATMTIIGRNGSAGSEGVLESVSGVNFPGEVPDIRPIVSQSAVYVCPMLEGGGTRLKVLDALAQGIPLVATRMAVEGIPARDGHEALLADDARSFADAVCSLFESPAIGERLALCGRVLVESSFSWDVIGARLRGAYQAGIATRGTEACAAS